MKRIYSLAAALVFCILCMVCFAGCGKEERSVYFDLQVEQKPFYDVAGNNGDVYTRFLGMQFYQGEPVQLWVVYDGVGSMDAYLYRMDGSRELIMEDIPEEYRRGSGFLDRDGNYYYWNLNQEFIKVDSSGKQLFSRSVSEFGIFSIEKLCQLEDGRLYGKCSENDNGSETYWMYEVDPNKGEFTKVNSAVSGMSYETYVAAGDGCLLCLTEEGVRKIDPEKGTEEEIWSFAGTSYGRNHRNSYRIWDFRICEDGSLELLEAESAALSKGADGVVETLQKIAIGEEREILVLRGTYLVEDVWLKECIRSFNEQSEEWYVIVEECGADDSRWEDYARQTSVEIASGEGPDILYGNVLSDYIYGVIEQGGFADLSPYLESSGLNRDDFFPCVFDCWRDGEKVYGASLNMSFLRHGSILMDAAVLGENKDPDIRTLVEALLAWEGDDALLSTADPEGVLERLLMGTEDLWGMVDWEEKNCNFGTELFAGILEAAKRYGRSGADDPRPLLAEEEIYSTYQYLDSGLLEKSGKVKVGILFDDGCRAAADPECVAAINANSARREGAWEFIRFVLENKQTVKNDVWRYPSGKAAFDRAMLNEKGRGLWKDHNVITWNDMVIYFYPLTKERIEELKEVLEDARFVPIRTKPILDIICEEAAGYFGGGKSINETIDVINNRVQVYLDERQG